MICGEAGHFLSQRRAEYLGLKTTGEITSCDGLPRLTMDWRVTANRWLFGPAPISMPGCQVGCELAAGGVD